MVSRKKYNEEAKRIKRKQFITASEARDRLAQQKYGYPSFQALESAMTEKGEWK